MKLSLERVVLLDSEKNGEVEESGFGRRRCLRGYNETEKWNSENGPKHANKKRNNSASALLTDVHVSNGLHSTHVPRMNRRFIPFRRIFRSFFFYFLTEGKTFP
jgi:hypothetical protein